jgi:hypothetical protein
MYLFLSYSRRDAGLVRPLVEGLTDAGHRVWFDQEVRVGEAWWSRILDQIRRCDVFVAVLSRSSLGSIACDRERDYASLLGKPILPVLLETFPPQLLPPDLAGRQYVDYSTPDVGAAFRLTGGLTGLRPAPPLPDPLPPPPEIPLSYLSLVSRQVHAANLEREDQLAVVANLRAAAADPDDREAALELVHLMLRRHDLLAVTERLLQEVLREVQARPPTQEAPRPSSSPSRTAPGTPTRSSERRGLDGFVAPPEQAEPAGEPAFASTSAPSVVARKLTASRWAQMLRGRSVLCAAFSPEGRLLATGGDDRDVRLWNPITGLRDRVHLLSGHRAAVESVAFNPSGSVLASAGRDRTVRLWDPRTGRLLNTLTGLGDLVLDVQFSPDGRLIATAEPETVRLWDTATGEQVRPMPGLRGTQLAFSPDGRFLASGGWQANVAGELHWTVELVRPANGQPVRTLVTGPSVAALAFGANGSVLASGDEEGSVRLWDPSDGRRLRSLSAHAGGVTSLAYRPDGRLLASSGRDRAVRLWDTVTGEHVRTLDGHLSVVRRVAWSPDGLRVATAAGTDGAWLWS